MKVIKLKDYLDRNVPDGCRSYAADAFRDGHEMAWHDVNKWGLSLFIIGLVLGIAAGYLIFKII